MVSGIVASVQGKEIAGKIVVAKGEKLAANERSSCEHLDNCSVHRNNLVGKYSGNC